MGNSQSSRDSSSDYDGHPYFITSVKTGVQMMKNQRQLYKKMNKEMTLVDTFWEAKRNLIKEFEPLQRLDQHAIDAPPHLNRDMEGLVTYLIGRAKNDLQKYRVLFRWISDNIAYDVEGLRAGGGVSTADEALRRRVAVCGGYVDLYKRFCEIADLRCDSINGYDKGANYYVGHDKLDSCSHAWCLIYLGDKPYYCDPTWAAGNVDTSNGQYKKKWTEHWFITDPTHFENTHLPNDQSGSITGSKYQSLQTWNTIPKIGPMIYVLKATLTEKEGVLHADEKNVIEISIRMDVLGTLQHFLTSKATNFRQDIPYHVMHYWKDNKVILHVRLPGQGTYKLVVYANKALKASEDSNVTEMYDKIVTYTIIGKSTKRNNPMKKRRFGSLPFDVLKGYSCVSHTKPIIETSRNRVVIEYSCPRDGDLVAKISKVSQPEVALKNRMYQERLKKKHAFHIHLPSSGWYYVFFHNEPKSGQYTEFAVFMINFTGGPYIDPVFPDGIKWNPLGIYYESSLKCVSHDSSYIRLHKGEGILALNRPFRPRTPLTFSLFDINSKKLPNSSQLLYVDSSVSRKDLEKCDVKLRIGKKGFYVLHLFVDSTLAMRWLVVCEKGFEGDLYPPSNENWGPSWDDFKSLDISLSCDSKISLPRGSVTLKLMLGKRANVAIFGKLVEANGRENHSYQKAVRVDDSDSKIREIDITLPEKVNEACLELYGGEKSISNSYPRIGKWLVVRK